MGIFLREPLLEWQREARFLGQNVSSRGQDSFSSLKVGRPCRARPRAACQRDFCQSCCTQGCHQLLWRSWLFHGCPRTTIQSRFYLQPSKRAGLANPGMCTIQNAALEAAAPTQIACHPLAQCEHGSSRDRSCQTSQSPSGHGAGTTCSDEVGWAAPC